MKIRMTQVEFLKYQNNMNCSLCKLNFEESEIHILQCVELSSEPELGEEIKMTNNEDIFVNLHEQIKAVKFGRKSSR
jgi:hypothetical protein